MGEFDIVPVKATLIDAGPFAALVARVLPHSWVAVRRAKDAIDETILQKLKAGEPLDQADVEYAERHLGTDVAKYVRLRRIVQRGAVALPKLLSASGEEPSASSTQKETSPDFVNKFRDDASLVDDEVLQEVYGRVLAQEASAPGSISLSTLRVLRYLDREVADLFSRALQVSDGVVFFGDSQLHDAVGIDHPAEVALADAGLLSSVESFVKRPSLPGQAFWLPVHGRTVLIGRNEEKLSLEYSTRLLTGAGRDLARVANAPPIDGVLAAFAAWLRRLAPEGCMVGSVTGNFFKERRKTPWEVL